ncbi:MAG: hypothetical protein A3G52_01585 [Candidatus Taylorbacteria bacterium RIFCSPLOWO2_12_FULL_43_20]|uniref:Transcobalamin-like C-terminal domain-containing protein n=1 Tax=Candidatus Taylorbacteria bacterium RIFCSPLOWO2_12_FULL_43_20 TaxID=1802332 RepID=A0A1G2NZ31_9BACT|nr:MAG: hypothetical protein A2825_02155 [Candidatus Taylorbacteria bacterium RIFCSPHIGHO2_01_FULL_43_120]OHA23945.1 MAG: hypothetical protein A3B98_03855 [Candidatus Taylorbacteria bacterium RIFCSPHIGHO2_02_FULL_43_55]OHA29393.1 MAG: hypothetical protein A3E92_02545 [Candidatus Taylorbacteria bacterium RIFCSPHIGHO2_12_FULL_42_34]OHA31769.1 MAG: hypothetical protein A3B09_01985 [Candidatus Taylorbacteria bacterium RIFCSPLOWO2_01_FULL_43_83]OHA37633.1 MAG: hypothetical protein A3H58_00315 [Candi
MSHKKLYFSAIAAFALVATVFFIAGQSDQPDDPDILPLTATSESRISDTASVEHDEKVNPVSESALPPQPISPPRPVRAPEEYRLSESEEGNEPEVSTVSWQMEVGDLSYDISSLLGSSLYEAMKKYQSESANFSFKAKYFPGMGYFIEEINGKKSEGGGYWTLYINSKESVVGASQYIIKEGDLIKWNYEKR